MKLSIDRDEALNALSKLQGVAPRSTLIPILKHVAIKANGALTMRATDLNMQSEVTADCEIASTGEITAPLQTMFEAVRSMGPGPVSIELKTNRLHLGARASFRLPTSPAKDFPFIPEDGLTDCGGVDAEALTHLFDTVEFAASRDAGRLGLCGVHLEASEGKLRAVATNRAAVAVAELDEDFTGLPANTIALDAVASFKRIFKSGRVLIAASDRLMRFSNGEATLITKVIDQPFINYRLAMPAETEGAFRVESAALISALRSVVIVAQDSSRTARLALSKGRLELASSGIESGEASDQIEVDFDGEPFSCATSANLLLSAVLAADSETLEIGYVTRKCLTIKAVGAEQPSFFVGLFG